MLFFREGFILCDDIEMKSKMVSHLGAVGRFPVSLIRSAGQGPRPGTMEEVRG